MLYVLLDFNNNLTIDALVESRAPKTAGAQKELDTIKHQSPNINLKINDPPNFHIRAAIGQLEKPLAKAMPKFEIGDKIFTEHFVVWKKLRGPHLGLHFMRNNHVVNDTTHVLIHFPYLTKEVRKASSETTAQPSLQSLTMP